MGVMREPGGALTICAALTMSDMRSRTLMGRFDCQHTQIRVKAAHPLLDRGDWLPLPSLPLECICQCAGYSGLGIPPARSYLLALQELVATPGSLMQQVPGLLGLGLNCPTTGGLAPS